MKRSTKAIILVFLLLVGGIVASTFFFGRADRAFENMPWDGLNKYFGEKEIQGEVGDSPSDSMPASGYGAEGEPKEEISTEILALAARSAVHLQEYISIASQQISLHYDIDKGLYKVATIFMATSQKQLDEIAVFEVADEEDIPTLIGALEKRATQKLKNFGMLLEQEIALKDYRFIGVKDNFVVLVLSGDVESARIALSTYGIR